jgi:hypothetical protein
MSHPKPDENLFCPASYGRLLEMLMQAGYDFVAPHELLRNSTGKQVVLRHDVDYSPQKALAMARLDRSLGWLTFFFSAARHWYNLPGTTAKRFEVHLRPPGSVSACTARHRAGRHRPRMPTDQGASASSLDQWSSYPAFSWRAAAARLEEHSKSANIDMYSSHLFKEIFYISDSSFETPSGICGTLRSGDHPSQLVLHPSAGSATGR